MVQIKWYEKCLISLFILFLIIVTVWLIIIPTAKSKAFYIAEFKKNDTVIVTGYTMEELDVIAEKIIAYLYGKTDSMQIALHDQPVFSNQALIHMKDVRDLFTGGRILGWIVFVLWLSISGYLIFHFKRLYPYFFKYSMILLASLFGILLALVVFAAIDFDHAFEVFHKIIFPNPQKFRDAFFSSVSNYPEIPGVDNLLLIKILSIELFIDMGFLIGIGVLVVLTIWLVLSIMLQRKGYVRLKEK